MKAGEMAKDYMGWETGETDIDNLANGERENTAMKEVGEKERKRKGKRKEETKFVFPLKKFKAFQLDLVESFLLCFEYFVAQIILREIYFKWKFITFLINRLMRIQFGNKFYNFYLNFIHFKF